VATIIFRNFLRKIVSRTPVIIGGKKYREMPEPTGLKACDDRGAA
jgi:hypothetical protein